MKSTFKWILIIMGGLAALFVLFLLLLPMFKNVNDFKPQIEKAVNQATGRKLVLGGDLKLSLFPWAGVSVKDVTLSSPDAFSEKEFLDVTEFEARMKLIPLLFKDVQVKHVLLKGFRLTLVQQKDGRTNWDFSGGEKKGPAVKKDTPEPTHKDGAFSLKDLKVGEISVSNGVVEYIDHAKGSRNEVSDVNFQLSTISLDNPIGLNISAKIDGKPVSLTGKVGPVGKEPGKGTINIDLVMRALETIDLHIAGQVTDPMATPAYQFNIDVPKFSPRKLLSAIDEKMVPVTSDSGVLATASFKLGVIGGAKKISLSDGEFVLDDTTVTFQAKAKEFSKPNVQWRVQLDAIDLDRYLPKASKKSKEASQTSPSATPGKAAAKKQKTDYTPLQKLEMEGSFDAGKLKAGGASMTDIQMKVMAKGGRIELKPLSLNLYQGNLAVNGLFDVRKDMPKTSVNIKGQHIQAGGVVVDMFRKDIVSGTAETDISMTMTGDTSEMVKKTLNGTGELMLKDGVIKGVDLGAMLQNVKAAFGMAERTAAGNQTEFAEFHSLFNIQNGLVMTEDTVLKSPVMTAKITGNANLDKETLKFKIDPTYIDVTRETEDGQKKTSTLVPVMVTGTFSSPKFQPDLEGVVKQTIEKKITDLFDQRRKEKGGNVAEDAKPDALEESVKGIFKQLPFGK